MLNSPSERKTWGGEEFVYYCPKQIISETATSNGSMLDFIFLFLFFYLVRVSEIHQRLNFGNEGKPEKKIIINFSNACFL